MASGSLYSETPTISGAPPRRLAVWVTPPLATAPGNAWGPRAHITHTNGPPTVAVVTLSLGKDAGLHVFVCVVEKQAYSSFPNQLVDSLAPVPNTRPTASLKWRLHVTAYKKDGSCYCPLAPYVMVGVVHEGEHELWRRM